MKPVRQGLSRVCLLLQVGLERWSWLPSAKEQYLPRTLRFNDHSRFLREQHKTVQ